MCCIPILPGREIVHLTNGYTLNASAHTEPESDIYEFTSGSGIFRMRKGDISQIEIVADEPVAKVDTSELKRLTEDVDGMLQSAATAQGVDERFIRSVAKVESGLRLQAISPKGARGLMQLMPGTAAELKVDATDPQKNALGGAMYLRQLLLAYNGNSALALAAYNAGPGAVKRYGGVPPFPETRQYIVKVLTEYKRQVAQSRFRQATAKAASKPIATD